MRYAAKQKYEEAPVETSGAELEARVLHFPKSRRSRSLSIACLTLLFLMLLIPAMQIAWRPLPAWPLDGLGAPDAPPAFSWQGVTKETFQKGFEQWFMKGNALWSWLVRINNQANFSLFNQVNGTYNAPIIVGREGHFLQPTYFNSFNRLKTPKRRQLEKRVRQLKKLQDLLAERGIPLIVLVSTHALELYPELVPADFTDPTRLSRRNSYEKMRPLLDEAGVNVFDAHQYLSGLKQSSPVRFFEPTGSHWNDVAACLVTQQLLQKLGSLIHKQLLTFACAPYEFRYPPASAERDLVAIANLLFPNATYRPAPYAPVDTTPQPGAYRPKLLFVGTSFNFAIMDQLEKRQAAEDVNLYFYYRQLRNHSGKFLGFDRFGINWEKSVFSNDAIVLESHTAGLGAVGYAFVSDALAQLQKEKKQQQGKRPSKTSAKHSTAGESGGRP